MSDRALAACFTAVGAILIAVAVFGWQTEKFSSQRITYDGVRLSAPIVLGSNVEIRFEGFKPGDLNLVSATLNGRTQEMGNCNGGLNVVQEMGYDRNTVVVLYSLRPGMLHLVLTPLTITERGHVTGKSIVIEQELE